MIDNFLYTLRPRQNGSRFTNDIFKCIFLNENVSILIRISLQFVPRVPINDIPALVQIMAWCRPGNKPLSETMMVSLLTHICITRPQWVNAAMASMGFYLHDVLHIMFLLQIFADFSWSFANHFLNFTAQKQDIFSSIMVLPKHWSTDKLQGFTHFNIHSIFKTLYFRPQWIKFRSFPVELTFWYWFHSFISSFLTKHFIISYK